MKGTLGGLSAPLALVLAAVAAAIASVQVTRRAPSLCSSARCVGRVANRDPALSHLRGAGVHGRREQRRRSSTDSTGLDGARYDGSAPSRRVPWHQT
jgi:hypothetical protein